MRKRGFWKEFNDFIKEYKILGIAIAFVVGTAASSLAKALVEDIIMPLVTPFVPEGAWATATFTIGRIVISWGDFLGELINFIIIALAVFIVIIVLPNKVQENQKVLKKKIKEIPMNLKKGKEMLAKLKHTDNQSSDNRDI